MKTLSKILDTIQTLPEEGKQVLAIIIVAGAAVILFRGWSASVTITEYDTPPQKKQIISGKPPGLQAPPTSESKTLSPVQGIAETFKSAGEIFKRNYESEEPPVSQPNKNVSFFASLSKAAHSIWSYFYEPLK